MELSRSEQKRRIKQLEKFVHELVQQPPGVIRDLPCDTEVRDLLLEAVALKGGARKRQLKYITKLLRSTPVEPLYDFMSRRRGSKLREDRAFHELEYMRDTLLSEAVEQYRLHREQQVQWEEHWDSQAIRDIEARLPGIDTRALARLGYQFALTRNRRHSREVFRLLRAAHEQLQFKKG